MSYNPHADLDMYAADDLKDAADRRDETTGNEGEVDLTKQQMTAVFDDYFDGLEGK